MGKSRVGGAVFFSTVVHLFYDPVNGDDSRVNCRQSGRTWSNTVGPVGRDTLVMYYVG